MALEIVTSEFNRISEFKEHQERLLQAALQYVRKGFLVAPLKPNSKEPALPSWSDVTGDPAQVRAWFGPEGPHRNGNIAIYITGFKVVDVDRHGEVDGFKWMLGVSENCPSAKTPNNGKHYLVTKTDLKEAPGLEILGEGRLFTVFPSRIDGKTYEWLNGGRMGTLQRVREADTATPGADAVALAPAGYVRALLEHFDPDMDYSTWLKVGMAIHHNDAGEMGLQLWEEWSANGQKFKPGECERRWSTFDAHRGKPVGLRWLIIEAVKNGRPMDREDMLYHGSLDSALAVDKLNERFGVYDAGGTMYVVYKENGGINMADPYNFKVKIADQKIEVDGKIKPLAEVWLEHPDRRIVTEVGMWVPGQEPEGALNSYEGFAVEPVPCESEEISLFLDFVMEDICRNNGKNYVYLMDMMAAKLQRPLDLLKIALVMRGGEGTGKGAFTRVFENIIGPKHSINVSSPDSWLGKFAGSFLKGAIWLSANEAHWSGNHSQAERLKALISEETLDLEEKFVKGHKQPNRLFVAITTNNDWAVPAGADSRRFFMLDVGGPRKYDEAFWNEFHARTGTDASGKLRDPEYLGKILWWFQNRKVTSNLQRALETEMIDEQRVESAMDGREDLFLTWIRLTFGEDRADDLIPGAGGHQFMVLKKFDGNTVIRCDKMYEDYKEFIRKRGLRGRLAYSPTSFIATLTDLGFERSLVPKTKLKAGGRPLPGADGAKISVANLPEAQEIEAAIKKIEKFKLFTQPTIEEDDE